MYNIDHDGEIDLAFRVIAETRKNLELDGDVAGLQQIDARLRIARETMLLSMAYASAERWYKLSSDDDELQDQAQKYFTSMSPRAFNRVWGRIIERYVPRGCRTGKEGKASANDNRHLWCDLDRSRAPGE